MTAASISLVPAQRASRWQLALAMLGVCLPVPVFAATGLSLPLPSAIERLAVSLVPWAHASALDANEALARGTAGTIPLDAEQAVQVSVGEDGTLVVVRVPRQGGKSSTRTRRVVDDRASASAALPLDHSFPGIDRRGGTTPTADGPATATPVAPEQSAPPQGPAAQAPAPAQPSDPAPATASSPAPEPAPEPAPAPEQPTPVVAPVVEEVVDTVDDTVGVVEEVVAPVVEPVAPLPPLLPGLGLGK